MKYRPDEHPLIKGAKALFESAPVSRDSGYLKLAKKLLVDLTVSKTGLGKALSFANQLFLSLESYLWASGRYRTSQLQAGRVPFTTRNEKIFAPRPSFETKTS